MGKNIKSIIQKGFSYSGRKIVKAHRASLRRHYCDAELAHFVKTLDPDLVIDVGGNEGQYRDFLRNTAGYEGVIMTFEPLPHLAEALISRSRTDKKWKVFNFALGATNEEQEFNVTAESVFSSFLAPVEDVSFEGNSVDRKITVQMRRLDDLAPELADYRAAERVFLKLDTQGFDLQVFAGARGILDRIAGIQSELSLLPIYKDQPGYREALAVFESAGFEVATFLPVSESGIRHPEYDCLMIRS